MNNWEYFIGGILPAGGWILERSVNAMVITKAEVQARVSHEMGWEALRRGIAVWEWGGGTRG